MTAREELLAAGLAADDRELGKTLHGRGPLPAPAATPSAAAMTTLALDDAEDLVFGRELGRGGVGVVREATQATLDRVVADKSLLPGRESPEAEHSLEVEARILGRLDHPCIVPAHLFGRDEEGRVHLLLRLVRGGAWTRRLDAQASRTGSAPTLSESVKTLERVVDAITYAHARGIVHRDLKPDNVLVGDFGEVRVTDWGLAHDLADSSDEGHLVGTPCRMAPEQARGEAPTPATDVYLLGGILYELLTGTPPHHGRTVSEVLARAEKGVVEPPAQRAGRGVPADLAALAMAALSPDPARRPTARAFRAALGRHSGQDAARRLLAAAEAELAGLEADLAAGAGRPAAEIYAQIDRAAADFRRARELGAGAAAEAGLARCLRRAADFALDRGDLGPAEAYLARYPGGAPADLRERHQALVAAAERERRGRRGRGRITAVAALLALVAAAVGGTSWRRAARLEAAAERRRRALATVESAVWTTDADHVALLTHALDIDPTWAEGRSELAGLYTNLAYTRRNDDPDGCARDLETGRRIAADALARNPAHREAQSTLCYADQMLGDRAAMRRSCGDMSAYHRFALSAAGVVALFDGDAARAERSLTLAMEENWYEDDATWRVFARYRLGDLDGALADIVSLHASDATTAEYYAYEAIIQLARGDRRRAGLAVERAARLAPRIPETLAAAAVLAAVRGDAEVARRLTRRARSAAEAWRRCYLDPLGDSFARAPGEAGVIGRAFRLESDPTTLTAVPGPWLAWRRDAAALLASDPTGALGLAARALAEDASDGDAHRLRALALRRLGLDEAVGDDLELADVLAPTSE